MKLTGIIEQSFMGQILFRGYATLGNLARISKGTEYQREVDEDRLREIAEYYHSSQYLFFPELIFGWYINDISIIRNMNDISVGSFQTEGGIKFKKAKYTLPEANYIIGENPTTKNFTIEIPENIVAQKLFNRIDGNHRLSVVDQMISSDKYDDVGNIIVPYSLLLQFATDNPQSEVDAQKYEAAYFYLINSKAKPLSTNENLKALLNDVLFSDTEKQSLLSIGINQIRYIKGVVEFISTSKIKFISDIFNSESYAFGYQFVKFGVSGNLEYSKEELDKIIKAIELVNCTYIKEDGKLSRNEILLASTIICYQQPENFNKFIDWIKRNEVNTITELSCENIIRLFISIHKQRSYKVFVAMPYISHKRVTEYNTLFNEILSEISKEKGFGLELIPIMRFRGESQRIDHRLIEKIKECDIFIGDLTTVNNNVIFEVGLAEGNNKKILLIKADEDTDKLPFDEATSLDHGKIIPFDMDKLQYIPYSNSGYYNEIKGIMKRNIPVIVEQLKNESNV